jgi:hypothetical protein
MIVLQHNDKSRGLQNSLSPGSMERIQLPFWLVVERKHILNPPQTIPCEDPTAQHAFTSTEKLTTFLEARHGGRWDVSRIADYDGLLVAAANAHQHGAVNICFDPDPDGSGGHVRRIIDILQASDQAEKSA